MNTTEIERLRFRNQYVLVPQTITCPFIAKKWIVTDAYMLYAHVDLPVTEYINKDLKLILLGDIFDYKDPQKDNQAILRDLADNDFECLIDKYSEYSGRYVLIYVRKNQLLLLHDSIATRKIFYYRQNDKLWFSSQPYILAKILDIKTTTDPSKLSFYNSKDFIYLNNTNIGDTTPYDDIHQLMPNHYYSVNDNRIVRYWPNKKIIQQPYKQVAERVAPMIRGFIESIASRYEIMIPVTAGKDSRMLAAGSHRIKDNVFFYVNKEASLSNYHQDIYIPRKLFKKLKMKFHIVDIYGEIDSDFRKIYFDNNPFASEVFLPHIFNYYRFFRDKINLPGNYVSPLWGVSEIRETDVNPVSLAKLYGVADHEYAIQYYTDWMDSCRSLCEEYNVKAATLFYWEERLANWGGQIQLDKDIAQEEFNPLNSRLLATEFLSVDYKYLKEPGHIFHKEIIRLLWPELLVQTINPLYLRGILKVLKMTGIYKYLK